MNKVFYSGVNTKYRYESYFIYQVLIIGILIMCISRVVRYHKIFFKVKTGKTKRYDEQKQFLCIYEAVSNKLEIAFFVSAKKSGKS